MTISKSVSRAIQCWNPHVSIIIGADSASCQRCQVFRTNLSRIVGFEMFVSWISAAPIRLVPFVIYWIAIAWKLTYDLVQWLTRWISSFLADDNSLCQFVSSSLGETLEFLFLKVNVLRLSWNFFRQQNQVLASRKCKDYDSLCKDVTVRGPSK